MLVTKQKNFFRNLGLKKSLRFFFVTFLLTTISLVFYYITPILFAWSGPSDLPPGGNIDLVGIVRNRFNMVEESVSGNVEIDLSQGSVFKHTLTGNVTYTGITGFSLGKLNSFKLVVEQDAVNVYEIAWPGNIVWKTSDNPLNLSLSSFGVYDFVTFDNGLSWYGSLYYDSRGGLQLGSGSGTRPICASSNRGMMWVEYGDIGEDDATFVCSKTSSETYEWIEMASEKTIQAYGGDEVYDYIGDGTNGILGQKYRVHKFTTVGQSSFTVDYISGGFGQVEYIVVGGGGGGAADNSGGVAGGGGGAGGYRSSVQGENSGGGASAEPLFSLTSQSYIVTVGGGGLGVSGRGTSSNNGSNSSFGNIVAVGGGGGGAGYESNTTGKTGGSGGGGGAANGTATPSQGVAGLGTVNQGYSGGKGRFLSASYGPGGSGGGAGGQPIDAPTSNNSTSGGNGVESSITGIATYRAGGGSGGGFISSGAGGLGGGGKGGIDTSRNGSNGSSNTGGGGGGALQNGVGGNGGSGIVIVRYKI